MTVADPLENVRAWWDEDVELDPESYDGVEPTEEPSSPEPAPTTPSQDFVHLHVHSEFSLLDGLSPVKHIVDAAKRHGMRSVALTDHGNMYGAIDFYSYAKSAGIKPILGVETYVSPRGMSDKLGTQDRNYFHLVLLAKNLEGYHNLIKLVSRASLEGYYYKPRIDRALLAEHAKGLIALSACYSGEPSRAILESDPARARDAAGWYREVFGEDYFLELQDHGNPDDQIVNAGLLELHKQLGIPLVATNDSHYALPEQATAQDVLLCVQTNSTDQDPKRMRMQPLGAFCLKSPAEMWQLFGHVPDALRNSVAIAERCDLKLEFGRLSFPSLDHLVPQGQTPQEFLTRTCQEGLVRRYGARVTADHRERLRYELEVVQKTDFAAYILFVWDFVDWARKRGIPCGPRGSAAGSIILYCLGISDLDPVHYSLTFERFLNPERLQMPDIDMDFADDRRDEVIQYVIDRYGSERVAQIITFGRLLARAAIRDVGRALDYPLNEVDRVAKLIPPVPIGLKIADALEQSIELKTLYEGQPHIKKLIDTARSVEGVARHAGTHAAGIVVADQPLTNYVPLQRATRGDSAMTQYDMKVLDKIGLIKMDFLGLANLTMLAKALDNIKQSQGIEIDLGKLPLDDAKTYAMLSRGETRTVFQLEGSGMTRSVVELQPSTLDHLAALVALYRPGPMAHIPSYILRRDGREAATPPDPSLEDVLKDSYGIIVYQDQVLQVVRKLAGYSLGQADVLRRAMGKKEKEVMALEGPKFITAAVENGYAPSTAEKVWDLLQPFAGYAFNKCLVANTSVIDAHTGERTTIGSLYSTPRPFTIHALGQDGTFRPRRVTDVMANGRKPVFELRTAHGRRITATANHPFRTQNGWTNLEDLRPGDPVAAATDLRVESATASARVSTGGDTRTLTNVAPVSNVFWDRVVSIEPRGEEPTYDLTVEIDHNFVADGLVVHNSHAFCYALVAYQTAYLKANYPVEWFAAVLSTIAADTDKVVGVVGECRRVGVGVLPPDVNASTLAFRVESSEIRFGLAAVKNVGEGAVEQIVREREANGAYTSLEEFCRRQDLHTINKRVVESLIKCGAMDVLGQREALLDSKRLDSAIAAAQIDQKAASTGQVSLFDVFGGAETLVAKPVAAPLEVRGTATGSPSSRERALWEKEVLGFQFGDHPFQEAATWLGSQLSHNTSQLTPELSGEKVKIAGLVTNVRRILTKTKSQMAVLVMEDLHGTIEAVVFPRIYERSLDAIRQDAILILEGKVDTRSDQTQLVVDRVEEWVAPAEGSPVGGRGSGVPEAVASQRVETGPARNGAGAESTLAPAASTANGSPAAEPNGNGAHEKRVLRVVIPRGDDDNACVRVLEQLHILVERSPGPDEIHLVLHDRAGARVELSGADILVRHSADLESQVRTLVGAENLQVVG